MIKKFEEKIREAKRIIIVGHKNPDLDSLGSMCGLSRLIEINFGKKPTCVYDGNLPSYLNFVPGRASLVYVEKLNDFKSDLLIVVDTANTRTHFGDSRNRFFNGAKYVVKIDHHPDSEEYGDLDFSRVGDTSASEIIFKMAMDTDWKIDKHAATALQAGIVGDTGQFRYVKNGESLRDAADLVDLGADMEYIYGGMNIASKKHILAIGRIMNHLEFVGNYVIVPVKHSEYKDLDGKADEVIGMMRKIPTVEFIILLTEAKKDTEIRMSFRSKTIPISHIASEYFNGGGHPCAAGGRFFGTLSEGVSAVKQAMKKV